MRLYEINHVLRDLYENFTNSETGEIDEASLAQLEDLESEKELEVEACGVVYKEYLAEAAAIDAEIKTLTERKRALMNKANNLKNYLAINCQGEKYKTPRISIGWRRSESVHIDPLAILPDEYTKIRIEPDKIIIKEALRAGIVIDGAELRETQNIQIK